MQADYKLEGANASGHMRTEAVSATSSCLGEGFAAQLERKTSLYKCLPVLQDERELLEDHFILFEESVHFFRN